MYAKIFLYCDTESFNSKEIIYAGGRATSDNYQANLHVILA